MNVQIRYQNGTLTIGFVGQSTLSTGGSAGDDPIGGNPGAAGMSCGGMIVGPIIVPIASSSQAKGGSAGDDPIGGSPTGGSAGDDPIGGNPGTGNPSTCGCPIVIGPIVFTNSGATATTATPVTTALQTVDISNFIPRIPLASPATTTPFTMEHQQEAQWCWAAVAVSVFNFLAGTDDLTQAALVPRLLKTVCDRVPNPQDPCNQAFTLDGPLSDLGNLVQPNGGQFDSIVKFADLQTYWSAAPFPVCARIVWDDGSNSAHFIALTASAELSNGQQLVSVHDPSPASLGPAQWDYDAFRLYYQGPPLDPNQPNAFMPRGHWNDTYFVQP